MKAIDKCPTCGLEVAYEPSHKASVRCPRCLNLITAAPPISGAVVLTPVNAEALGLQPVRLMPGVTTLGRKSAASRATVQFDVRDLFMSKGHASISVVHTPAGYRVTMRDTGSANGTYVNEQRISEFSDTELHSGDNIRLGSTNFTIDF